MPQQRRPGYTYWFPARHNGWGWGAPKTWQGWLVLDAFIGCFILFLFIALFGGGGNAVFGIVGMVLACGVLFWVCTKKGEPRRRWGR